MNFILLNPDEMRAESVGCYGHPLVRTPHLDRLAAEGTRFEQCHAQHTVCTPSRCSFMTGLYPSTRGHRTLWHSLRRHEPHLFRYLQSAGYEVRWYGKNDLLTHENIAETVTEAASLGQRTHAGERPWPVTDPRFYSFLAEPYAGPPEEEHDTANYRKAVEFLRSKPRHPFCLFLPTSMPHPIYSAPQPWHDRLRPEDLPPLRPVVDGKPDFHYLIRRYRNLEGEAGDGALMRKINAVYLGMIEYVDHLVGGLLDALDETGLSSETTVLFFSDHGDWAGDYGLVEKWSSGLDDTLTRVPLLVRLPRGAGRAGHVVREPVELFDQMATILDLAGIPARHTHFARSLVPQLHGAPGDLERAVFAEGGYATCEPHCFEGHPVRDAFFMNNQAHIYYPKALQQQEQPLSVCRCTMLRTLEAKLIRRPEGVSEFYDLREDPRELRNLYGDPHYAALQRRLELRLLDHAIQCADTTPWDEDPRGLPPGGFLKK